MRQSFGASERSISKLAKPVRESVKRCTDFLVWDPYRSLLARNYTDLARSRTRSGEWPDSYLGSRPDMRMHAGEDKTRIGLSCFDGAGWLDGWLGQSKDGKDNLAS